MQVPIILIVVPALTVVVAGLLATLAAYEVNPRKRAKLVMYGFTSLVYCGISVAFAILVLVLRQIIFGAWS